VHAHIVSKQVRTAANIVINIYIPVIDIMLVDYYVDGKFMSIRMAPPGGRTTPTSFEY
jgi:hypothetical protein